MPVTYGIFTILPVIHHVYGHIIQELPMPFSWRSLHRPRNLSTPLFSYSRIVYRQLKLYYLWICLRVSVTQWGSRPPSCLHSADQPTNCGGRNWCPPSWNTSFTYCIFTTLPVIHHTVDMITLYRNCRYLSPEEACPVHKTCWDHFYHILELFLHSWSCVICGCQGLYMVCRCSEYDDGCLYTFQR